MNLAEAKLLHYELNLDYSQRGLSIENQTNMLINKILNEVVEKFKDEDKYFVLDYHDDTISLIAYNIVKQIQSFAKLPLLILNKRKKNFKKFFKCKEKFISNFTFNKLKKQNKVILLSCDNPIYKVNNVNFYFNENSDYNLMDKFTLEELNIAKKFYNLKDVDNLLSSSETYRFDSFCRGNLVETNLDVFNFSKPYKLNINIIKLTGDNSVDSDLISKVIDKNEIILYYISGAERDYEILQSEFQYYLKNKTNIPNYWNINNYELLRQLKADNSILLRILYIGGFTVDEKAKWY